MGDAIAWESAVLPVLGEAAFAAWQRQQGRRVVEHRGRHWSQPRPGFHQPVHFLARLSPEEATRPSPFCWGFRARLADGHEGSANGALPVHLLPDLAGYDLARLSPKRRRLVRVAMREVDHVALASPRLLLDQGHAIAREANAHNPRVPLPEPEPFRRWVESHFAEGRGLALAAVRDGRLLAFTLSHAVDGTAYQDVSYVGTEGRRLHVAMSLFHALATLAQRSPAVRELANGLHARESGGLDEFKSGLGLEVVRLPARAWMAPVCAAVLRRARPDTFYRLTGRD